MIGNAAIASNRVMLSAIPNANVLGTPARAVVKKSIIKDERALSAGI